MRLWNHPLKRIHGIQDGWCVYRFFFYRNTPHRYTMNSCGNNHECIQHFARNPGMSRSAWGIMIIEGNLEPNWHQAIKPPSCWINYDYFITWFMMCKIYIAFWQLTHWGRVTHICVSRLTITGSDNGLSPERRQAIIWTNAGILLIGPLGTNFSEFLIVTHTFSFNKMHLKMSSAKWRPFCLGLNMINKPCSTEVGN